MSVKQLKLIDDIGNSINVQIFLKGFLFKINDMNGIKNAYLDRGQAHLLMLYLQEHLK